MIAKPCTKSRASVISEYVGKNPCLQLDEKDSRLVKKYYDLIAERYQTVEGL